MRSIINTSCTPNRLLGFKNAILAYGRNEKGVQKIENCPKKKNFTQKPNMPTTQVQLLKKSSTDLCIDHAGISRDH